MNAIASFVALLIVALGYGVLVPLGPALVERSMGPISAQAASLHTGALSGVYLLAFAALAPMWGRAVDASSRRLIAAGGLVGFALAFATIAMVPRMELMYVALAAAGVCAAAIVPAIQVQIGRVEGDLAKARLLAALGAASFAGSFLGPTLVSSSLAFDRARSAASAGLPLGVVAILGLAAAALMLYALPAGSPEVESGQAGSDPIALRRRAWRFGLLAMAAAFGLGGFEVSLVLWVVQVVRLEIGLVSRILVECTVVMMVVQATIFFLPAARPRWNRVGAGVAFGSMAAAVALTPLAPGAWAMFALVAIIAAAATLLQAMLSFGTVTSAGSRTGAALGLQLSLSSVGQGLGSFSAGALFSPSGGGFYASAALLAAAAIWAASTHGSTPAKASDL